MAREKRDVKELRERAINSLVLGVELFNRPYNRGRAEGVIIILHHAFEMLLKSIIKNRKGTVYKKGNKYSYSFSECLEISQNELKIITKDERFFLSILDTHRDTVVHYYQIISEDLLYIQTQSSVTLFNDILKRSFEVPLSDFIPDRVLPISIRPPKNIQILIDSELGQVDDLLGKKQRKSAQATATLRSIMAFATASRENAERVTEGELCKAIQRRKAGEEWKVIFPEIAQLQLDTEGAGLPISLRITKTGIPVRMALSGEDALVVRDRDWFDKYSLSLADLNDKLGKTVPKIRAYMFEINIWNDPEMYGEKKIKSQKYKRYTKKALDALKVAISQCQENVVWERHKDAVLGRKK